MNSHLQVSEKFNPNLAANNRVCDTITFHWNDRKSATYFRFHDRTYIDALAIVKDFGYKESKWYNPWTWGNYCVINEYQPI